MINPQIDDLDNIPVLSNVVIPGVLRAAPDPAAAPVQSVPDNPLTERLKSQAFILLEEIQQRIERMVEEELANAHSTALETARLALQQRLRTEMEERLNAFITDAVQPREI